MVEIIEVNKATDAYLHALNRLLPQLSGSAMPLSMESLESLLQNSSVHLYFAVEDEEILGTLSLVIFQIPTGIRAWVEDVVVESKARGKGVGRALSLHALSESRKHGAQTVDLTSRPSRQSANHLYQSVGFEKRETNIYRFKNA